MSSTNLNQNLGVAGGRPKGFPLKMLHVQVGNYRADQLPHGQSFNLFIEFILEREVCIVADRTPRGSMMFCTENTDLSHKVSSCSNRSLIILRSGSMGTDVNNAETSYELRYSPGRRVTSLTVLTNSLVLCTW